MADLICGVSSNSGPNGEPLACGYRKGHDGPHAWASLPTWAEWHVVKFRKQLHHDDSGAWYCGEKVTIGDEFTLPHLTFDETHSGRDKA